MLKKTKAVEVTVSDDSCYSYEKLDLFLGARGLPNLDNFSTTDPFAVVYLREEGSKNLIRLGETEVIQDTLDPDWTTSITIDYIFEEKQNLEIHVFHSDGKHGTEDVHCNQKHTLAGKIDFLVTDLMRASGNKIENMIYSGRNQGKILVRGEPRTNTREVFSTTFMASKLVNKAGFFGKSDPFLQISRMNEDGEYTVVWRNEHIDNNLSPKWPKCGIPMVILCNGDLDRPLRIEIFDWVSSGNHYSMGCVDTSVRSMLLSNGEAMNIIEPSKKAKSNSYTNSGTLTAWNPEIEHHGTLTDYITGGCEIALVVGIDFTASNGDPRDPSSLHYYNPYAENSFNEYQQAIKSVGDVLEPYDTDKKYPVYGFGGKLKLPNGAYSATQHCFPVYGDGVEVQGVSGILQAYKDCLDNIMLSGPTLFAPLITTAATMAKEEGCTQDKQHYTVLLIITDGAINDMDATIEAVIHASYTPLSIIIIGVGDADFSSMVALDSDDKLLSKGNERAMRDIVQFVSFREASKKGQHNIAKEVLHEIPTQILGYMKNYNIVPNTNKG